MKTIRACATLFLVAGIIFSGCRTARYAQAVPAISGLKLIGSYNIPFNQTFNRTTIGGLSGIDYNGNNNEYYAISDDRSAINPARFYTLNIAISPLGIDTIIFKSVTHLLQRNGVVYPKMVVNPLLVPDPESIRYNPFSQRLTWSSEGERIVQEQKSVLVNPSIYEVNMAGKLLDSFSIPENVKMRATANGPRQNGVIEGLAFADRYRTLYASIEEPLHEDGSRAGINDTSGYIRIIKYNVKKRIPVAQYGYLIDPVAYPPVPAGSFSVNGVPEILWIGGEKLLVVERSFSTGKSGCTIKIYIAELVNATNIQEVTSLKNNIVFKPASKMLLMNMDTLGLAVDNIEGVTFGPILPNGHRTLLFVSDNNFLPIGKTQFLLFEVLP